jgi:predicted Zn-dependent peptidase
MWDPYAEFESTTLPNGLTVYAAHWPERPWETMGFMLHSGAEHDPIGFEGMAHFVEHLASEHAGIPSNDLRAFFGHWGGRVALGSTGWAFTHYRFWVPNNDRVLSRALSLFGNMLLNAKIEHFIERERQVILGEFHRHFVHKFVHDLVMRERRTLYGGYWLERFPRPLGEPESLARITKEGLQFFYDTHYTPSNMSVVGVGGLKLSELVKLLSESPFAVNKEGRRMQQPNRVTNIAPPTENRYVFELSEHMKTVRPFDIGGYKSVTIVPTPQSTVAMQLLSEMLNQALTDEVRKHHAWTYDIHARYEDLRHFYELEIQCDKLEPRALEGIESVVEKCIDSMTQREDLFERQKQSALAGQFMTDASGRGLCDEVLNDLALHQHIITITDYVKLLESTTMDDVRSLLPWLRPGRRWNLITKP